MHTPRYLETPERLHVGSFDPAVSLTEDLPQGVDADILLLGCGDARHILYTLFFDKGLPERKLDITACDVDEHVIARNILLFTLLLDNHKNVSSRQIWNIYYHFYLDDPDIQLVGSHAESLVNISQTLQDWHTSPYGTTLRFCDETTFSLVHNIWAKYSEAAKRRGPYRGRDHWTHFNDSLYDARIKKLCTRPTSKQDVSRSCAPLAMEFAQELVFTTEQHWKRSMAASVALPAPRKNESPVVPNPIFAVPLTASSALNFPTNPLLSFHLAAAHANLAELSPLRLEEKRGTHLGAQDRLLEMALMQFADWTDAFVQAAPRTTIRFTAAECFALCYTLRYNLESGKTCAQHYRGKLGLDVLKLAESDYGIGGKAPKQFDVIDTSTLSDDVSVLNLVVSAGPLLKDHPSSTLYTTDIHHLNVVHDGDDEKALSWNAKANLIFCGLIPAEYWTNATASATADQILTAWSDENATAESRDTLFGFRLSWKQIKHLVGQNHPAPLHVDIDALVALALWVYEFMISSPPGTQFPSRDQLKKMFPRPSRLRHHHPGNMAAFLWSIADHAQVDSRQLFERFLKSAAEYRDTTKALRRFLAAFTVETPTPGLRLAESWGWRNFEQELRPPFKKWSSVPPSVAITVIVPTEIWKNSGLFTRAEDEWGVSAVEVIGHLSIPDRWDDSGNELVSAFPDVQFSFGTIKTEGSRDDDDFMIHVQEDKAGWKGSSPMIITYFAPTEYVETMFTEAVVSFYLLVRPLDSDTYQKKINVGEVFESPISDEEHVFITKYRPGATGYPVTEAALLDLKQSRRPRDTASPNQTFTVALDKTTARITTITGRVNISSPEGLKLLVDRATIKVEQPSPFTLDIVFGKDRALVLPLTFPAPVLKEGSKTRIARTSHYIEIRAPFAQPLTFPRLLDDFLFPTTLTPSSGIPATFNIPHLNLDTLPILSVTHKSRTRFLTTLTSLMFSTRERRLREETAANNTSGLSPSPRLNFKESLFTIFMLASGLQGGQTGLFALANPQRGGIHMLLFVSAIRLDGPHGSVVLDAAVLPFTKALVESKELEGFLLFLRTLECCTLTVDDAELVLWKRALPALAERCRTWMHGEGCEYVEAGRVPVSVAEGEQVLCGCGMGKLPGEFISLPEWETTAQYATRVAISPVYASPLVEELISPDLAKAVAEEMTGKVVPKCRNCGNSESEEVKLKKCLRCLEAMYCSTECQKKDWKKHRMECEESEVYHSK
ncbi:hypothetical protein N657DRAFT_576867 [Parathielavia appendiculata]|uniref:MYND-type domain-containing protein n=1 Tax=Parathielavia appendiculata TaxID=2587402 RepID=A0AAN6Z1Y9_9PEZI|nr:hypothetical protein N657DRAFT_576867 [Parathielavia appendiculata]